MRLLAFGESPDEERWEVVVPLRAHGNLCSILAERPAHIDLGDQSPRRASSRRPAGARRQLSPPLRSNGVGVSRGTHVRLYASSDVNRAQAARRPVRVEKTALEPQVISIERPEHQCRDKDYGE